jgi:hypothetical protein
LKVDLRKKNKTCNFLKTIDHPQPDCHGFLYLQIDNLCKIRSIMFCKISLWYFLLCAVVLAVGLNKKNIGITMDTDSASTQPVANRRGRRRRSSDITIPQFNINTTHENRCIHRERNNAASNTHRLGNKFPNICHISTFYIPLLFLKLGK